MWTEMLAPVLLLTAAICTVGWFRTSRRLAQSTRDRTDLANSSLAIEVERQMLELIATGASESEVLDTLTQAIERISPESLCTVMLLDEEDRNTLLIASGPSLPQVYLQAIARLPIGSDVGACGSAAFRNETIIVKDIATDPRFAAASEFVLSHGLRSCWSQPIRDSRNMVLGTFATYRRKIYSPRPEELRLARVAAQLAGNAIERIRAERKLSETLKRLSLAETVARFGIWDLDLEKHALTLSVGLAAMLERPLSALQLTTAEFESMVHAEDLSAWQSNMDPSKARTGVLQGEFRLVLPSGAVHWMRSQWSFELGEEPPTRATGAMIDITKEKDMVVQAEREVAAAEASELVARQAERLEQDRKAILELVANDRPLEQIVAAMAEAITSDLIAGSLCAIRVQVPDVAQIALYPDFPAAVAAVLDRLPIASLRATSSVEPIEHLSNDLEWDRFMTAAGALLSYRCYRAAPVQRNGRTVGMIISLLPGDHVGTQADQNSLESWGRVASLAVERRGLYEQLSFRAQYDSLTNLLNRASLYERVDAWIRTNSVERSPFAIIYLDLNSFKEINDGYGHGAGDKVLQHVSAHILDSVRRSDIVARIGGDEFVVILPGIGDRTELSRIAGVVATAIARPLTVDGRELRIGVSIGTSIFPIDGDSTDALLKIADKNMYRVKRKHRALRSARHPPGPLTELTIPSMPAIVKG
jgi:diguanylate cyclase (GGDEF)-like protein